MEASGAGVKSGDEVDAAWLDPRPKVVSLRKRMK